MPFAPGILNINLSVIFILATAYVIGYSWANLLLFLRLLIGPGIGTTGYSMVGMWSHTILLIGGLLFLNIFLLMNKIVFKKFSVKKNLLFTSMATIFIVSIVMTLLNGLLFTPVFFYLLKYIQSPTINNAMNVYPSALFFGIPSYWGGIFTVFGSGNVLKYLIITIGFIPIWKISSQYRK